MGSSGTALLFVPPLPPVQLPAHGTLVVGRSGGCDLRLADADTSRRHAKIVCEDERIVLHDLASTNGTFVNGQKVEEHTLEPGDRIQRLIHSKLADAHQPLVDLGKNLVVLAGAVDDVACGL